MFLGVSSTTHAGKTQASPAPARRHGACLHGSKVMPECSTHPIMQRTWPLRREPACKHVHHEPTAFALTAPPDAAFTVQPAERQQVFETHMRTGKCGGCMVCDTAPRSVLAVHQAAGCAVRLRHPRKESTAPALKPRRRAKALDGPCECFLRKAQFGTFITGGTAHWCMRGCAREGSCNKWHTQA